MKINSRCSSVRCRSRIPRRLSEMLKKRGITHKVLNAKYHAEEAEIISRAGQPDSVTIATNMAGRGTDILLGEAVADHLAVFILSVRSVMKAAGLITSCAAVPVVKATRVPRSSIYRWKMS